MAVSTAKKVHPLSKLNEIAEVLVDLLQSSFESRTKGSSSSTSDISHHSAEQQRNGNESASTPISLATQLVTFTTALYKECNLPQDQLRHFSEENDRIVSKIPHDDAHFSDKILQSIRILTLRALVSICYAGTDFNVSLQEIVQIRSVETLMKTVKNILQHGGLAGKQKQFDDRHCIPTPHVEVSASNSDSSPDLSPRVEFILTTVKNIFDVFAKSAEVNSASEKRLSGIVTMLQEFDRCGGYDVLERAISKLMDVPSNPENFTSPLITKSPKSSTPTELSASSTNERSFCSTYLPMECKLKPVLRSFEDLLKVVKAMKTECCHQRQCRKRVHRHCDLSSTIHLHHAILGTELCKRSAAVSASDVQNSNLTKSSPSRWGFSKVPWGSESPKSKSKKKHKSKNSEEPISFCVVAKAVHFIVNKLFLNFLPCARLVVTSIDKIGVCHCTPPGTVLVPLLMSLPHLSPATQDAVLATVGRMLLQRMGSKSKLDVGSHLPRQSSEVEDATLTLELPDNLATISSHTVSTNEGVPRIARVNVFDFPDSPLLKSPGSILRDSAQFQKILADEDDFSWLCLACYRDLIYVPDQKIVTDSSRLSQPQRVCESLAVKVASHLETVGVHLDIQPMTCLFTTVIMPILRHATRVGGLDIDKLGESSSDRRKNLLELLKSEQDRESPAFVIHPQVVVHLLKILHYQLDRSGPFRKIFIRHLGMGTLTILLLKSSWMKKEREEEDAEKSEEISGLASSCLASLLRNVVMLASDVKILLLCEICEEDSKSKKASPRMKRKKEDQQEEPGILSSLMKSLTPVKSKSPKLQRRLSPFHSRSPDSRDDPQGCLFAWRELPIDEVKQFRTDVQELLFCTLKTLLNLAASENGDHLRMSDQGFSDSEDHLEDLALPAASSLTTGYDSKSRNSSITSSSKREFLEADAETDSDSFAFDIDNIHLPIDDFSTMRIICRLSSLIFSMLQDNVEVQDAFFDCDGPELMMKILTLVATSLILPNDNSDFTFSPAEVSMSSFLQSVEEQARYRAAAMAGDSGTSRLRKAAEVDGVSMDSTVANSNLASSDASEREVSFAKGDVVLDDDVSVSSQETSSNILLDFKLDLLTSSLSISLLCAGRDSQDDFTSDDIISGLKPLLQRSGLMRNQHCRALCKALFAAAIQTEPMELPVANIGAAMSSLKQEVSSPRKTTTSCQRYSMSESTSKALKPHKDSFDSIDLELSDDSSMNDAMFNIDRALGYDDDEDDDDDLTDGYQGDSESDKPESLPLLSACFEGDQKLPADADLLVKEGTISNPELTTLMIRLLGVEKETAGFTTRLRADIIRQERGENIRAVLHTISHLLKHSQENFEALLSGCDFPLACFESFRDILQDDDINERDIRQKILELCLTLNNYRMSARHIRLVLSFFNSENPPLDQLLHYLLLLIEYQYPGPSQYLRFPITDPHPASLGASADANGTRQEVNEVYSISAWKVAPLRMPIVANISWPTTNVGVSISLWIQIGQSHTAAAHKNKNLSSWESDQVVVIDANRLRKKKPDSDQFDADISPYHHLVSIGTKQSMLQVWLEGGTLIFRICVDPDDGKPVGVLAQAECPGILQMNGEWQHLSLHYSENKLPDKTIFGKAHVISNCTMERDVVLEQITRDRSGSITRKNGEKEKDEFCLFLGHCSRSMTSTASSEVAPGYKLGTVMLFEGIRFTVRSALAIFRRGPNLNNLMECLVSNSDPKEERKSSPSVSSRIRLSCSPSHISSPMPPLSPTPGLGSGGTPHFFLLPHALLLSDVVADEFFSDGTMPSLKNLQEHLVLSYSPTDPAIYLSNPIKVKAHEVIRRTRSFSLFSSTPSPSSPGTASDFDPLVMQCTKMLVKKRGKVKAQWNRGLHRALNQVGGIQVFLMLCARVVEVTAASINVSSELSELRMAEKIQCLALEALLKLRKTDCKRREEFTSLNVAAMLHKLLTKPECIVGCQTLRILFNATCSGDEVIMNMSEDSGSDDGTLVDHFMVNVENSALIYDQELLQVFLTDWRIWHKAVDLSEFKDPEDCFPVWRLLLQGLLSLVRHEHSHQWFNAKSLMRACTVHRLLTGLQQMVTDDIKPFPGSSVMSHMMELFRALIGSPPNIMILTKICDFLVATHPPASTFVCHTHSSFYFNLRLGSKKGYKSQPLSPVGQTSPTDGSIRPNFVRSISAPVKLTASSPKRLIESLLATASKVERTESYKGNGLADESAEELKVDAQVRKAKALSVIEEANSPESGMSSRDNTPTHLVKNDDTSSRDTLVASTQSESTANNTFGSWVYVNQETNPKNAPLREDSIISKDEDADFTTNGASRKPSSSFSLKSVSQSEITDVEDELSYLTSELLNILFIAVMTMQDIDAFELTAGPLCAKAFIVGVHHKSSDVRTSTLRMLAAYFSRCSQKAQDEFLRQKGFHLVANQLYQHAGTRPIVDACLYFLLGHPALSAESLPLDGSAPDPGMMPTPSPDSFTNHASVLLLAVVGNTTHDARLCRDTVARLQELFECMGPIADVMLDNGLTIALCNLITSVLSPSCILDDLEKESILAEIQHFMTCIAVKSCVTAGSPHFQVFEDLFTLLHVIENEQVRRSHEKSARNVARIQSLSNHILLMVMELIQKSAGGKSPMVPRKLDQMKRPPHASFAGHSVGNSSRPSYSRHSSMTPMYPASELLDRGDDDLDLLSSSSSSHKGIPQDKTLPRRSSLVNQSQSHKSFAHRRSFSSSQSVSVDSSSSFRSHGGGLRTRSFKGSQRRRINEAETARRLQRVVIIAVDKLLYTEPKTEYAASDKDSTFTASIRSTNTKSQNDVFQEEESECRDFIRQLFENLLSWLTVIFGRGPRSGPWARPHRSSQSPSSSQGWQRILHISRDSLLDQASRLFIHLLSPWQPDLRARTLPLSIVRRNIVEQILPVLFPKDSKESEKVSIYLHYLVYYYKQQMTKQEKRDLNAFYKLFHRLGGKIHPMPQTSTDGVVDGNHFRKARSSVSEKDLGQSRDAIVENIEKSQALFDKERQRSAKLWLLQSESSFEHLRLRTDHLSQIVSQHAMDVTQQVVLRQNLERKKMTAHMKDVISNDLSIRKRWAGLLEQLAHERAVWYDEKRYPKSWQLDATEGPNRERRRLQRCHLDIDGRFMLRKSEQAKLEEEIRKQGLQEKLRQMLDNAANVEENDDASEESTPPAEGPGRRRNLSKRPLSFLFEDDCHSSDSVTIRTRLQTNERISVVQTCTLVTASSETSGEVLIGESAMYFVGDEKISDLSLTQVLFGESEVLVLSWRHEEVSELHKRWWQLQDIATEVFLTNGKTYLLAFKSAKERDLIVKKLHDLNLPNLLVQDSGLDTLTQLWRNGGMTNFQYLTQLNKAAGRSFNDLMQYPVMPFVLADYTSAILDLNNVETFRNLLRPISIPDDERMEHYKERYRFLQEEYKNCAEDEKEMKTTPYHYSSHYSNSGTVLHFLVRLPPYTQMFLDYQDASFDVPDRTFHSMKTSFRLSCYSSTTDVKELIPEFFFLPEFLCNLEGFDFGVRQCGLRVNHVTLPPWSKADPRLFVLINRQALESDYVSANLHGWIDLVFGYKQSGKAAVDAINVFHPATYFGMDVSSVEDPVKRKAVETMIKTYGQTPKQLFRHPHPAKNIKSEMKDQVPQGRANNGTRRSSLVPPTNPTQARRSSLQSESGRSNRSSVTNRVRSSDGPKAVLLQRPLSSVLGLKWGRYLGSPSCADPATFLLTSLPDSVGALVPLQTNDVCALAPKTGLLVIYNRERGPRLNKPIDIKWSALLTFAHPDNIVRLKMRKMLPDINLLRTQADDRVTCCAVAPDCRAIVLGHRSGAIVVNRCSPASDKAFDLEFQRGTTLYGHFMEITCLVACGEFRILASGSKDGTVVLWDLDALTYVRSLTGHATAVSAMSVSRTSGDVCTVCNSGNDEGSHIRLWTINGSLLAAQDTKRRVNCVAFSAAAEGISVNVVAGGMSNGVIRMWSSWDLIKIRDIETQHVQRPITCITFTHNSEVLYAACDNGLVVGWCFKDKLEDKQPILISFLNVGEKN